MLDAAVLVFLRKGYEGTSLLDLTDATGVNRPSLYAAFGNKESLFRRAVDRYEQTFGRHVAEALNEPRVRDAVRRLLAAPLLWLPSVHPRGCLLVGAALTASDEGEPIRRELIERRCQVERVVRARLDRAVAEGELRPTADVERLAKFVVTFDNGLAVQRAAGAATDDLCATVDLAASVIDAHLARA